MQDVVDDYAILAPSQVEQAFEEQEPRKGKSADTLPKQSKRKVSQAFVQTRFPTVLQAGSRAHRHPLIERVGIVQSPPSSNSNLCRFSQRAKP